MKVLGITGGIGSGKSTLTGYFERMGAFVVYADDLAKSLMTTDDQLVADIKKTFGDESYLEDRSLNKPHLIREAFQAGRTHELNAIVHPAVYRETQRLIEEAREKGYKLFVKEAALLLNNGRPKGFDTIILVDAPEEIRIARVMQREGATRQEVTQRLHNQPDFSKLHHLCDEIIINEGTRKELEEKARGIYLKMIG